MLGLSASHSASWAVRLPRADWARGWRAGIHGPRLEGHLEGLDEILEVAHGGVGSMGSLHSRLSCR